MTLTAPDKPYSKSDVRDFWNELACGEVYARGATLRERLDAQAQARYALEPVIPIFANFSQGRGKDVLEIGTGMGTDHLEWAEAQPRSLTGIDLTERAVEFTRKRLEIYGFTSDVRVADAEELPFESNSFDLVFSYGVLHHSPDCARAIREVYRVLRPGGTAKVMIYHTSSIVGYMLWARYGLLAFQPRRPLRDLYASHLESPGTRAFTLSEAQQMFSPFASFDAQIELGPGDLLTGEAGQRHAGLLLSAARKVWPRWFIKRALRGHGLEMLISAVK